MKRLFRVTAAVLAFVIPALVALMPSTASGRVTIEHVGDRGVRLFSLRLGTDVGVSDGRQAARILPASFDVDEAARRVDVLDTVRARVVSYGFDGARVSSTPIVTGSTTVSDIERSADGSHQLLDPVRGEVIDISGTRQVVVDRAALRGAPANLRLTAQPDATVDGSSIVSNGLRFDVGRPVFDVVERAFDGRGVLWMLADVDDGRTAVTELISVDGLHAELRTIDGSVFGDVTRRMVALRDGVVVMHATRDEMTFTRYVQ